MLRTLATWWLICALASLSAKLLWVGYLVAKDPMARAGLRSLFTRRRR
jgi:hypothetical protein